MPLESIAEWRARIGSSWCALGHPFKSKSSGAVRSGRVLSQNQVETMMAILSICFIHLMFIDIPGLFAVKRFVFVAYFTSLSVVWCLLEGLSVAFSLKKAIGEKVSFVVRQKVFNKRMVVFVVREMKITVVESALSMPSSLINTLLLISGDVELNPGPGSCLDITIVMF